MCCPVLRLDESYATVLAIDIDSGQRIWSTSMGGGTTTQVCANLYVDSDVLIQGGRGRIDGSDHYSLRLHEPSNGQQIKLLNSGESTTFRTFNPVKTANYIWVRFGTTKVIDASTYAIYGSVSSLYAGAVSGQDKTYEVGTTLFNSGKYLTIDKDGTTSSSVIAGVTTADSMTIIESSGYAAIQYNAGSLFGVVSDSGVLLSNSSTATQAIYESTGQYVATGDFSNDIEIEIQVWDTTTVATGPKWSYTDTFPLNFLDAAFAKPSPDGLSMYIIDSDRLNLHKVNSSGIAWTATIAVASESMLYEMHFDADGNPMVCTSGSVFRFDPSIPGFVSVTESRVYKRSATDGSAIWDTKFYKSNATLESGGTAAGFSVSGNLVYVYGSQYSN